MLLHICGVKGFDAVTSLEARAWPSWIVVGGSTTASHCAFVDDSFLRSQCAMLFSQ